MQHATHFATRVVAAAAIAALAAGCSSDSSTVAPGTSSHIAFTTGTNATSASATTVPVTNGGHTLDLTSVTLTISRAELKRSQTDACPGDNDGDDDHPANTPSTAQCGELKVGPFSVSLPMTGSLVSIPANTIPAGTYRAFELRVSTVELKGTFDGAAFDDTIAVHVKSESQFSTPLVVTADQPTAITVNVPVANWLVNTDGTLIDPTHLSANPSVLAQVRNRIVASFRAFEDRDEDGHEDHGR